ncbi:UDP-glucose 4-epimerase [Pseudacidovorax intermedius]|uniref:UDP-glucose 4-epimerase n=1 Tax=Pseudacidovorax intermedius TaxID=433924 RepID=A0A370FA85_9BURK|nr:UDP-glucose 4-epimerase GalE [Pseudacidovorax intermedius]RDI21220.1 UDP-glucose 4-epimerase [Pseudacidovorax intermedius]
MILVTGGAGFIGSHTCVALAAANRAFVVLDNFDNSRPDVLTRVGQIIGREVPFVEGDVRDEALVRRVLAEHGITAVIHFAALKAVGESMAQPLRYYDNNVAGTVTLLRAMQASGVRQMVFSSSATVYGDPDTVPVREDFPFRPANVYGHTKAMMEQMLADLCAAEPDWRVARLRYFNPVGAHESGLIGEDPQGIPNNLMPYVAQVAVGQRAELSVFGNDYPTPDGTGVRDYIHVMDLAEGHVAALDHLDRQAGLLTVNLGTGRPASVLDLVKAFERACGKPIPYKVAPRRAGDVAEYWADPALARELLGWQTRRDLDSMCADAWRWQSGRAAAA